MLCGRYPLQREETRGFGGMVNRIPAPKFKCRIGSKDAPRHSKSESLRNLSKKARMKKRVFTIVVENCKSGNVLKNAKNLE